MKNLIASFSRCISVVVVLFLTAFISIHASAVEEEILPVPEFINDQNSQSSSGHIRLDWEVSELPEGLVFELQRRDPGSEEFITRYQGPDLASFVSGLPNGTYAYRVRSILGGGDQVSEWSQPLTVVVQHHSLGFALLLFGLGAFVFLMTVGVIVKGTMSES